MALTISSVTTSVFGNKKIMKANIAFDSSYPTGGEALTPSTLGLNEVEILLVSPQAGYLFEYDYSNEKLKALTPRAAQAAVTTDKVTIVASGAANITDGQSCTVDSTFRSAVDAAAGAEAANTTDLSAVTGVRVLAIGV